MLLMLGRADRSKSIAQWGRPRLGRGADRTEDVNGVKMVAEEAVEDLFVHLVGDLCVEE